MNKLWTDKRSLLLSQCFVYGFTIALLVLDITGWWIGQHLSTATLIRQMTTADGICFTICLYSCSVPAYIVLYSLHKLLKNIKCGKIFIPENVKLLRRVSWCLFAAAGICTIGCWWLQVLLIIVAAAGFVGLIVRIVKNVIEQAIIMKDELDLTV